MKNLRLLVVVGLVTGLGEVLAQQAAGPDATNSQQQTQKNDQNNEHNEAQAAKLRHELDIRYVEVYLALAKLELQRALDTNKQIPGTFTNTALDALRLSVQIATAQLQNLQTNQSQRIPAYLISAEANARGAAAAYKRAVAANQQSPGALPATELERLRLTAILAELSLDKAKLVNPNSKLDYLQWQADQIREDLYQLRNRLAQFSRMN